MTKPSSRLIASLWLAIGFVLFRFIYAFVFTGASAGQALLDLPGIRLGGIFSHVRLFGPIGDHGLATVLQSAIPFMLTILAFGVLSYFVGPEEISRFALKSRSNFTRALGVSLSTLPALAEAAKRIFEALSYRSAPKRYLAIPLFETAIERANAISQNLTATQQPVGLAQHVLIHQLGIDQQASGPVQLEPGDALLITGATGSGKTTLLRSLAARPLALTRQLQVEVFGHDAQQNPAAIAALTQYVPQQPRDTFLNWRVDPEEILKLGISLTGTEMAKLSEGEAVRFAIAKALARKPKLLVLDEPYAALDDQAVAWLNKVLSDFRATGGVVVIAEHDLSRIDLVGAKILSLGAQDSAVSEWVKPKPTTGAQLLKFEGHSISSGEMVCLLGANAVGKTSFLKRLLKFASTGSLPTRFVPERVEDLFLGQTLAQEMALSDKLSKSRPGVTKETFDSLIPDSESLLETHPRDLSSGTKLALALSIAIAQRPKLLLIDEPVKGLDQATRLQMAQVLGCVQEMGCAIVFATHDKNFAALADRVVEIQGQVRS